MRPARALVALALALAAVAAPTAAQFRLPTLGAPPGQCVALANGLASGACAPVARALRPVAGTLAAQSCAELAASPLLPLVTPACCADLHAFVAARCACDPAVNALLAAAGVADGALAGGVRLAQSSICVAPANGGSLAAVGCPAIVECPAPASG